MRLTNYIFIILSGLLGWSRVSAQDTDLKMLPGTYRNPTIGLALKSASGLNQLRASDRSNVVRNLTNQHTLLMNTSSLSSFTGMEARFYAYVQPASAFQKITTAEMRVMFYPFTKERKTGKITPVDEAPATFSVYTNNLDKILFNVDRWWDETKKAEYPQFFYKFPVIDSTANHLTVKAKGQTFRILQLNKKPVFIPLTRKEFLQFLRQRAEKFSQQEKADYYRREMAQLSPGQAASAVYFNDNKSGDYDEKLAPVGRRDGKALYKVNPDYFDKSKSSSARQLLVATYWYHNQFCPDWMQAYLKTLFDEIDYSLLNSKTK